MATLPRKVAKIAEFTGHAPADRAQVMAQRVGAAHEQTKAYVQVLANRVYGALTVDTTTASGTYSTLITASITTLLATGFLLIHVSACGDKTTNAGIISLQVVVDGVVAKGTYTAVAANSQFAVPLQWRVAVAKGPHVVTLQWKTSTANATINAVSVNEEHATMLVQESA
jgi:hypothetical protein